MYRRQLSAVLAVLALCAPAMADWLAGTIPDTAHCAAVNPATNKIYVARHTGGFATVVDGATFARTMVPLGGSTTGGIAVNPVTNKVYVSGSPYHTVIDGATNDTALVPAVDGCDFYAVAVNPVTNKVYVANSDSGSVTVIDGATNDTVLVPCGGGPYAVAVNPVTNKVYVANYNSDNVTVIDGATNDTALVPCGTRPSRAAVNLATNKIYVANSGSKNVTVIDGATNATSTVAVDSAPGAVAVNPVSNRIYVANRSSAIVSVIDGVADTVIRRVTVRSNPTALAVNPLADEIYVAHFNSDTLVVITGATSQATYIANVGPYAWDVAANPVTGKAFVLTADNIEVFNCTRYNLRSVVIGGYRSPAVNPLTNMVYLPSPDSDLVRAFDAVTGATACIPAGDRPRQVEVNSVTNTAWAVNSGSGDLTLIDCATLDTTLVPVGVTPYAIAVNVVTNKVYVADSARNRVAVIDGATLDTLSVPSGAYPCALAVNPATNKVYVANRLDSCVTVIDGLTNDTALVPVGDSAFKVVLNPLTNRTYVATSDGVSVIDGATDDTALVACSPVYDICVNPVNNKVYASLGNPGNRLLEIDGETRDTTSVGEHLWYVALAVDPVTNKLYARNYGSGGIYVIDCAGRGWVRAAPSTCLSAFLAVNPVLGRVYMVNGTTMAMEEHEELPRVDSKVRVAVDPVPDCTTSLAHPSLSGTAVNRLSPHPTGILGVLVGAGTAQFDWNWANLSGSGDSVPWTSDLGSDSLVMGENFVCCVALEDDAGTTNNLGLGTPYAGNLEVYPLYRMEYQMGVEEASKVEGRRPNAGATVVRGVLCMGVGSRQQTVDRAGLLDIAGRKVAELRPGANDVRTLAPGVYFVRDEERGAGDAGRIRKVIVQR